MSNGPDVPSDRVGEAHPPNLVRLFGQIVMLPVTVLVQSMGLFIKAMRGVQSVADTGIDTIVGGNPQTPAEASRSHGVPAARTASFVTESPIENAAETIQKERRIMNKDLRDDMLKLVRYKILFVKREYEHAFPEREDLVSDNMDGSALTAWKIAEFIQELGRGDTAVPTKWKDKGYPPAEFVRDGKLIGLREDDKKYLRLYYEVLERYPREKFKYEEQQIRVLEEIRDKLP
jgi:hypothetical protein